MPTERAPRKRARPTLVRVLLTQTCPPPNPVGGLHNFDFGSTKFEMYSTLQRSTLVGGVSTRSWPDQSIEYWNDLAKFRPLRNVSIPAPLQYRRKCWWRVIRNLWSLVAVANTPIEGSYVAVVERSVV